MRAFVLFAASALVVGVSGILVIVLAQASGDFDPVLHFELHGMGAMLGGFAVFVIEAIAVAIVSVRRHRLAEWAAGFAGVLVGIVPYWILFESSNGVCGAGYICEGAPGPGELAGMAGESLLMLALPVAAAIFLGVGVIHLLLHASSAPSPGGPTAPPPPPG